MLLGPNAMNILRELGVLENVVAISGDTDLAMRQFRLVHIQSREFVNNACELLESYVARNHTTCSTR
jgi:hypothetical protein